MSATYLFDLERDDNGTFLATCPAFPEITTFVDDVGDLFLIGLGAIEEAIAARIARGEDIPKSASPSEIKTCFVAGDGGSARAWVKLPHQTTLKVMLYGLIRSEGLTRAELARRLDWNRESVDRLFRLDHSTRLSQFDAAFRELGQDIEVSLVPVRPTRDAAPAAPQKAVGTV
ncbi:type II toxin-antitoxin system HicB family antitoxin [Methylobacterium trifolii]|uniref:Type II toxin-antitoxin system HicB family antitoxin n=1 Tax=Methylobacterium trifolii TaxID=1003092 RepID=A0ABQ4U013_9HYPH|nr:type II toxin-antitoxin system HicB family antitoxin [Methylobacterium trifolii]GJE60154.1 hypothetical protein MPOCJGCO_2264 [Methylobacterium trifolii]